VAQSILGRIGQLLRANVNALVDAAEDPERMLDQLLRDYTSNMHEAESAVAQTIANLRMLEEDQQEAADAVREWGDKAAAASRKADQLRTAGQAADADRFDELARVALRRQISYEQQSTTLSTQVAQQRELTGNLKDGLEKLRLKREELLRKRDELVSRAKVAQARVRVQQAVQNVSVLDPTSELSRFEERVRREEAMAEGLEEVSRDASHDPFAQLAAEDDDREVESRFAQLKSGGAANG
jgi:phage shock protein A